MVNDTLSWPVSRLGEALEALARQSGFSVKSVQTQPRRRIWQRLGDALGRWLEAAAGYPGLEAEPVGAPYAEVKSLICSAGPALRLPGEGEPRFALLVAGGGCYSLHLTSRCIDFSHR